MPVVDCVQQVFQRRIDHVDNLVSLNIHASNIKQ